MYYTHTHTNTHTHTHTRREEIASGIKSDAVHGFRVFGESVHVLALKFSVFYFDYFTVFLVELIICISLVYLY